MLPKVIGNTPTATIPRNKQPTPVEQIAGAMIATGLDLAGVGYPIVVTATEIAVKYVRIFLFIVEFKPNDLCLRLEYLTHKSFFCQ